MSMSSPAFQRLVGTLKRHRKTVTVVEQCCGGLISSSIMAQPGASALYYGGSVSYNTKKSKPLLLNNEELYRALTVASPNDPSRSEAEQYIERKLSWTAETSVAFCRALDSDYAIAEGGASGPTFRPKDMERGFAVICVAGKDKEGAVSVLAQEVIHSHTNDREYNMRYFADQAAILTASVVERDDDILASKLCRQNQGPGLDRAVHLRAKESVLQGLKPKAKYIILQESTKILVGSPTEPAFLDYDTVQTFIHKDAHAIFLGVLSEDESPVFAIDLPDITDLSSIGSSTDGFVDTRTTAPLFSTQNNELVLHATALAQWQRRTKYCALCGGATVFIEGGTACQCTKCRNKSWPRQDPSIIVLVSSRDGQRVLLGKSPRHPDRMYTVLAGFVEAGETFESAVARESFEETGALVDEGSAQYCGSQPWPFPQSCMIGFIATADDSLPLNVDTKELVDARWFDRSDVEKAATVSGATMQKEVAQAALRKDPSLPLLIPPKGVIARKLIDQWLAEGTKSRN